jgi:hypothetical protein
MLRVWLAGWLAGWLRNGFTLPQFMQLWHNSWLQDETRDTKTVLLPCPAKERCPIFTALKFLFFFWKLAYEISWIYEYAAPVGCCANKNSEFTKLDQGKIFILQHHHDRFLQIISWQQSDRLPKVRHSTPAGSTP